MDIREYTESVLLQHSANHLQNRLDKLTSSYESKLTTQTSQTSEKVTVLLRRHLDSQIEYAKRELAFLAEQGIKPVILISVGASSTPDGAL